MVIRLYLDEHVPVELAAHLRRLGYDVLTTAEAGRASQRIGDESQLEYAARQARTIVTFNHHDYAALDGEWKAVRRKHAGIILSPRLSGGALCRRIEAHVKRFTAEQHHNLLLWC